MGMFTTVYDENNVGWQIKIGGDMCEHFKFGEVIPDAEPGIYFGIASDFMSKGFRHSFVVVDKQRTVAEFAPRIDRYLDMPEAEFDASIDEEEGIVKRLNEKYGVGIIG